jgi:hypothetical protein
MMDPHRKMGIYMGYHSPFIIKYLKPMTEDLFTVWYADCIFNEDHFLTLGGVFQNNPECQEINWDDKFIISSDPRTQENELQVQKIINLQNATSNLPDAFTYYNGVMKYWNPVANAHEQVELQKKSLSPLLQRRGGGQKPLARISLRRSGQERRRLKLLENPRK